MKNVECSLVQYSHLVIDRTPPTMIMPKTFYLCYFGLREPLVQTQVIPYLLELLKYGYNIALLTFEPELKNKWTVERIEAETKRLAALGIEWHCLPYHKRFSAVATAYDIFRGAWFIRKMIREAKIDILHGRVHVPTLMGALARKLSKRKPKLLFDIRGFFPEEYTDAGIWPEGGLLYRSAKRIERWLIKEADGFVVLTEKARSILFPESLETGFDKLKRPVEVIPCCVDFGLRFFHDPLSAREAARKKLGLESKFVIVHSGALGGLYLTSEIVDFIRIARDQKQNTFALILTQSDPSAIVQLFSKKGIDIDNYLVTKVLPSEIPEYLCASDLALSFVKSSFSTQSRSPTKIAEYLACGLPVVANAGVGDVDTLINENRVGALVEGFDAVSFHTALEKIDALGDVSDHCCEVAKHEFDLTYVGGERYRRLYASLLGKTI